MHAQAYHTLRDTPLLRLDTIPPAELQAYARTCPRRTRLMLLALVACRR